MSRREFRALVAQPRPASAWLMSLVASATLWLTEQLPLWVIGVQCLTFAVSFLTRKNPPALLKNAILLNVLMAGITTLTIRSALDGNPATISLAYFTALSQGLQLLDARPRKSEFVLVALALFQVILASNLTDSVYFSPLILIFLASVTWTLLVHTISMEAAEAGDPMAAAAILAPDLRRMTIRATGICMVLAIVIFVLFPRLKTNLFRGGPGSGLALSGFSDRVTLGDVGKIRLDHSLVLRVEGVEGELPTPDKAYWRGLAFDEFDGTTWSISNSERVASRRPISGVGRFGIELRPRKANDTIAQRIIREPVKAGVLFVPGDVQRIEGSFQHLEGDRNGGLYLPGRGDERIRYTIRAEAAERDAPRLRQDIAIAPLETRVGGRRPAHRYLSLPDLDPAVTERTRSIVAEAENDFDRALLIQESLRRNGRYTDTPPALGDARRSPIGAFILGELEGHCEYFASAMVAMARTQGLPSRLVNGFAGGVENELGGFIEVTQADAHAWVEIHFEKAGWVRFDPTPPDLRLRAEQGHSLWTRIGQLGGALELWWFQRVVDFDSVDQIGALRGIWLRWTSNRSKEVSLPGAPKTRPDHSWSSPFTDLDPKILLALLSTIGFVGVVGFVIWQRSRDDASARLPRAYREALGLLAKRGLSRPQTSSARDFAFIVGEQLSPTGGRAFEILTERYLAVRFGSQDAMDADEQLSALVRELKIRELEGAVDWMGLRDQTHVR
jgi:hypothetical protein